MASFLEHRGSRTEGDFQHLIQIKRIKELTLTDLLPSCAAPAEERRIFNIDQTFEKLRDPGQPISTKITALTGITDDMVAGKLIDPAEVAAFANRADLVIAHNTSFDRRFLERFCDVFACVSASFRLTLMGLGGRSARMNQQELQSAAGLPSYQNSSPRSHDSSPLAEHINRAARCGSLRRGRPAHALTVAGTSARFRSLPSVKPKATHPTNGRPSAEVSISEAVRSRQARVQVGC
jgi:hypothetical protein